jgi:mono/diheme cytochrome c family protein
VRRWVTGAVLAAPAFAAADTPTFTKDVAPILFKNCTTCHRAGEIGPMPLTTFAEARPWARAIRTAVTARTMPPWGADTAIGHFANDPRLSASEVATIAAWVDGGAPEGNARDLPPLPGFATGWQIGTPDVVLISASV